MGAPAVSQRRKKTSRVVAGTKRVYTVVKVTREVMQCERPYVLFGLAVRNARHELGWNQQTLADKMGYSRGSIANIETGRQRILLTDISEFARVLKIDKYELFAATTK